MIRHNWLKQARVLGAVLVLCPANTQTMYLDKIALSALGRTIEQYRMAGLSGAVTALRLDEDMFSSPKPIPNILETVHCLASILQAQSQLMAMLAEQYELDRQLKNRISDYATQYPQYVTPIITADRHDLELPDTDPVTRDFIRSIQADMAKGVHLTTILENIEDFAENAADRVSHPAIDWQRIRTLSARSKELLVQIYAQNPLSKELVSPALLAQAPGCCYPVVRLQEIVLHCAQKPGDLTSIVEHETTGLNQKRELLDWYTNQKATLTHMQEKLISYLNINIGHKIKFCRYRYNRFDREQKLIPSTAPIPTPISSPKQDVEEPLSDEALCALVNDSPSAKSLSPALLSPRSPLSPAAPSPRTPLAQHHKKNRMSPSPATPLLTSSPSPSNPPLLNLDGPDYEHTPTQPYPVDQRTLIWHINPHLPLKNASYATLAPHKQTIATIRHRIPWCLEHYFRHLAINTTRPNRLTPHKQDHVLNFPGCVYLPKKSGKVKCVRGVFTIGMDAYTNRIYHRYFHTNGDEFLQQKFIDGLMAQAIMAPDEKMGDDLKEVILPPLTIDGETFTYKIEENEFIVRITDKFGVMYELHKGHLLKKFVPESWLWE